MVKPYYYVLTLALLSGGGTASYVSDVDTTTNPQQTTQEIDMLLCKYCTKEATNENSLGDCKQYTTPLNKCYNPQSLYPNDVSWGDVDILDELMLNNQLKRTFYKSKDGSCNGRVEKISELLLSGIIEPNNNDNNNNKDGKGDSYILPLNECVGPFGKPRPFGKFSLHNNIAEEK